MKRILILGGTQFIGRNLVEALSGEKDLAITLFNRNTTKPDLFPEILHIRGDRETQDIAQISGIAWDYVIDLSAYYPDALQQTLAALDSRYTRYIFISTCSVYDLQEHYLEIKTEESPLLSCSETERVDRSVSSYGNRKAACERILQSSGFKYTILRPALVFGKYDHTDRLYYWLYQVKNRDQILLPDHGERKLSLTYVHDLILAIRYLLGIDLHNQRYNAVSFPEASIGQIVQSASAHLNRFPEIISADPPFLHKNQISQWTDMPLWIDGDYFKYDNQALKTALNWQPTDFASAISETIHYFDQLDWPEPRYGISEERRSNLIQQLSEVNRIIIPTACQSDPCQ